MKHKHETYYYTKGEVRCFTCGEAIKVDHDCFDHGVEYESDGPLGHGWECGRCGAFIQAG